MDFYPYGIRAITRGLKAHTVLDTVARHFLPDPCACAQSAREAPQA